MTCKSQNTSGHLLRRICYIRAECGHYPRGHRPGLGSFAEQISAHETNRLPMKHFFRHSIFLLAVCLCGGCVIINKSSEARQASVQRIREDIPVFTAKPALREYKEISHYEAIGSNISSFDRVLTRIKSQARRDGCEALVKVRFYRQTIGRGARAATFPTIEAVGIRYAERNGLANN